MIKNLSEYFLPEQEFYLHKVVYDRIDSMPPKEKFLLNCADNINVEVCENNEIKIIVTRSLAFEPEEMFRLTVAFGADLKFDSEKVNEYNWQKINLAEEFRNYGDFVINNLMSRISLLIGQITSSFGQQPLILPPNVVKADNKV